MLENLLQRWQMLTPRERQMVFAAAAVLLLGFVYLLLFEPAWSGRKQVRAELPTLRSQLAQVEQLSLEARNLGAAPVAADSPQAVKAQLESSITAAGLGASLTQLTQSGQMFDLRFKSVAYAAWLAWLDSAVRETRLRVVDAAVTREAGIGRAAVRVTLELPRREGR